MTYALHDELQPKPYVYKPSEIRHRETGLEKFSRFGMILNSQEEESHNHNVSKEDSIFSMPDKINPPEKNLNNKLSNFFGENLAEKFRSQKVSKIKADKSAKFHTSPDLHPTSPKRSFNPCPNHGSFSTLNPSPSALYFSKTGSKVRPEREKITKERKAREAKYIERDKRMQKLFKEMHEDTYKRKANMRDKGINKTNISVSKYHKNSKLVIKKRRNNQTNVTEKQLQNLVKYKHKKILASKKRIWAGEEGKFKQSELKQYFKHFDAYQLFIKKNKKSYKFLRDTKKTPKNP